MTMSLPSAPVVTVIIPTYNRSARLRPAVLSALSAMADVSELEIVIADDHSPDDTPRVCRELEAEFPAVRSVRLEKNGGAGAARNAGIAASGGEFLAFLDDDDWRLPGSLDAQVKRLREAPEAVFCYGPVRFAESETGKYNGVVYPKELPEGDIFWRLSVINFPQVPSVVVRRSLLKNLRVFSPQESNLADWDAWLRLAHDHPVVAVNEPVAGYRLPNPRSGQLSSLPGHTALDAARLQKKLLATLSRPRADHLHRTRARRGHLMASSRKLYGRMMESHFDRDPAIMRESWRAMLRLQPGFALRRRILRVLLASYFPALMPDLLSDMHCWVNGPTAAVPGQDYQVTLSILIPTYNRCEMLPGAVRSALEATAGTHFSSEIWIIDDASSDATPAVCEALRQEHSSVGFVRLKRNAGLANARNYGLSFSKGRYVALLDDDDLRLPNSFAAQIEELEGHPEAALCYGPVRLADADMVVSQELQPAVVQRGDLFWELLEENFIRVPSVILRRDALNKIGGFDSKLRRVEDQDRWVRLAHDHPFVAVDEPVAIYRQCDVASGQLSGDHAAMVATSARLLKSWLALPRAVEAPADQRRAIQTTFADKQLALLRATACQCLEAGMARAARRDLVMALRLNPLGALRRGIPRLWLRSFFPVPPRGGSPSAGGSSSAAPEGDR